MLHALMSLLTVSFHLNFGRPLGRFSSIFISTTALMFSILSPLLTWPNHSSLLLLIDNGSVKIPNDNGHWSLSLRFIPQVPWPINIILNSKCMQIYNEVFSFLLQIKRAKYSLDRLSFEGALHSFGHISYFSWCTSRKLEQSLFSGNKTSSTICLHLCSVVAKR